MKCRHCNAQWTAPPDKSLSKCPFCKEPLIDPTQVGNNASPDIILQQVVEQFDVEILGDKRLGAVLSDFMPHVEPRYLNVFKKAVQEGIGARLLELTNEDEATRTATIHSLKSSFRQNNGFDHTADYVVDCFLFALGWLQVAKEQKLHNAINPLDVINKQVELAFANKMLTTDESGLLFQLALSMGIKEEVMVQIIDKKINEFYLEPANSIGRTIKNGKDRICGTDWIKNTKCQFDTIVNSGLSEFESYIQEIRDKDVEIRRLGAEALGELGNKRATEPLISVLLNDEDSEVRIDAAIALGKLKDVRAIESLIFALENDDDNSVRSTVASELCFFEDERVVKALIFALENQDNDEVRRWAAESLGSLNDKSAIEPLINTLEHLEESEDVIITVKEALKRLGAKFQEFYLKELGDEDFENRILGVKALGGFADKRAVEPLISVLLNDEESSVRGYAAESLGSLNDKSAIDPLISALENDEDDFVRSRSATSLGDLNGERAIPPLLFALDNDTDEAVRIFSKFALKKLGHKFDI